MYFRSQKAIQYMQYKTFNTERLHLRPASLEDVAFVLKLLNTPKWHQYIGDRNVKTMEDAKKYIEERMRPQLERLGFGNYTVIRKEDGMKLGCCGIYDREGLEGVDIGFSFLPEYEKKGYAYESALCLKDAAFTVFNLKKIGAITLKENTGSIKLLKKLGLQFKKMIQLGEDPKELSYYELNNPTFVS
ncbi:MAG: ribosomal-protein-alanine N-acetyltransferase [Dokdonia sp.]|jgi:RimJ/RimL family protein N-acetyltransferase